MSDLRLHVHTAPSHLLPDGRNTFAPTTATLIAGDAEAVLVDTHYLKVDVDDLGDMIESTGLRLATIFITHGHADHYFGLQRLLERFPSARPVAAAEVAEYIAGSVEQEAATFGRFFSELTTPPRILPIALDNDVIELEGHALRVIHVGQADIPRSTCLHIPSLDAVIAGDVVYNQIHQMLALSGPEEWAAWIASIEKVQALQPQIIIAGHKKPEAPDDDAPAMIAASRQYITDFAQAVAAGLSSQDIVATLSAKWPDHGNLTTLTASAAAASAPK